MNAGHVHVALGKSSTEYVASSKQVARRTERWNRCAHVLDEPMLNNKVLKVSRAWMAWVEAEEPKESSRLNTLLKSERTFHDHHAMPADLDPLNDIIVRLHLDKNP